MNTGIYIRPVLCVVALVLSMALAQSPVEVTVAQSEEYGEYLTDSVGRTLYLFIREDAVLDEIEGMTEGVRESVGVCDEECRESWPPLSGSELTAGGGLDADLLYTANHDVESQVVFNGWPLYYFAGDQEPGEVKGQGIGDVWYLVSPSGEPIGAAEEDDAAIVSEEVLSRGNPLYRLNCASCHGREGQGGAGPALASNTNLQDSQFVVNQILFGGAFMPGFANELSDQEIADVATYIRNSWGNEFGAVTAEEVEQRR